MRLGRIAFESGGHIKTEIKVEIRLRLIDDYRQITLEQKLQALKDLVSAFGLKESGDSFPEPCFSLDEMRRRNEAAALVKKGVT